MIKDTRVVVVVSWCLRTLQYKERSSALRRRWRKLELTIDRHQVCFLLQWGGVVGGTREFEDAVYEVCENDSSNNIAAK